MTITLLTPSATYAGSPRISRSEFRQKTSNFVQRYYSSSPLADQNLQDAFYDAGEENGVDPRFFVAISAQETSLYTAGCAVRNQNNNMFNWFWNPTKTRCKDSLYPDLSSGVDDTTLGIRRWIKRLNKISASFNAYDFVLNPDRRYCTVECTDCVHADDTSCRMSLVGITDEVAGQCSSKLGTCKASCTDADGCDSDCKCWSPNVASFMEDLGGDPCNIWFDTDKPVSTERACSAHEPSPPSECALVALQPQLNFGAVPIGSCQYASVVVQNQVTCDTLIGSVSVSAPFRVAASTELKVKKGQARSILIEFCGLTGAASGILTLTTNRGSATAVVIANGCNSHTPEVCDNGIDDNCDGLADDADPLCQTVPPICGNGIREAGEACDDGNVTDGDCCSSQCIAEELGTVTCGIGTCVRTVSRCVSGGVNECIPADAHSEGPFGDVSCTNDSDDDCDGFVDDNDDQCVIAGLNNPEAVIADSQFVYYGEHTGLVSRVQKSGGTPTALGRVPYYVSGLTTDESYVYVSSTLWSGDGGVFRVAKSGGVPSVISYANQPDDIEVDNQYLYWSENNGGSGVGTYRIPKDGGTREAIGSGTLHGVLKQDSQNVFFRSYTYSWHNIWRVSKDDLSIERMVTTNTAPLDIAISADTLYWIDSYNGIISAVSRFSGVPTVLVSGLSHPSRIMLDGTYLYWLEREFYHTGSLRRINVTDGTVETLRGTLNGPYDIAIDDDNIYLVEYGVTASDGVLKKIKK